MTSPAHLRLLGRRRSAVVGVDWREWMLPEDLRGTIPRFERLVKRGTPYEHLCRVIRDGEVVPTVARVHAIRGRRAADTLFLCEMQELLDEDPEASAPADRAAYIRDLTYDLAAMAGGRGLSMLAQALITASATAERTLLTLTPAGEPPAA